MAQISVAIHGFGNIGKYTLQALETAPDMVCTGVIRRASSLGTKAEDLRGVQDYPSLDALEEKVGLPQVVILCGPSRHIPQDAVTFLEAGLNTVDSYDIHTGIADLVQKLGSVTHRKGRVAITAAGWDPGSDSVLRALFEAMTPVGTSFTNFGRGRSMGHSVAARAIDGVADATSITIPIGGGRHSRLVYVLAENSASEESILNAIAQDPYFSHDPLEVRFVPNQAALDAVADESHGVLLERTGASGLTSNQQLRFDMRINNPALTAQILVSAARATTRLAPGSYTLIDVPLVALLPGERIDNIARLV